MTARKSADKATDVAVKEDAPFVATIAQKTATGLGLKSEQWADVDSWDVLQAMLTDTVGDLVSVSEIGTGFVVVDKADLVGRPFVILDMLFKDKDKDNFGDYVTVRGALFPEPGAKRDAPLQKIVFSDGGAGIYQQCSALLRKFGKTGGYACAKGLSRSDYTYTDDDGNENPATTFYLDESPA